MINYFRFSKSARGGWVTLEDSGFSGVTALVLTYLWTKSPSAGGSVTDLPQIQRCHQPHAAENWFMSTSVILARLVLFLVSMWSSALPLFNGTWDRMIAISHWKIQLYIDMHYFWPHVYGMHIINPHRRHTNRALTLKCIVRIWTSGGLSVDWCVQPSALENADS